MSARSPIPSQRAVTAATLSLLAALSSGCLFDASSGVHDDEDDPFVHRAYTAWQPLPSRDGSALAFTLEPRRVDADSRGVMITGWRGQVAGDGVVVGADGAPKATLPRAFLASDWDDDEVLVWAAAASTWTPVAPNDHPPPTPYASVTRLDRATLAPKGARAFDPPLAMPHAMGGGLVVDTPRPGDSDFERDVRVTLHDLATGTATVLHEGRGFRVATCDRGSAITVAYQRGTDRTTLVDVALEGGAARVAKLDRDDLVIDALVCRRGGHHVAALGGRPSDREGRALVLARAGDTLAPRFENSVGVPAALSLDGSTLLATGPDGAPMLVTERGARAVPGTWGAHPSVHVSGDRALVGSDSGASLVRLDGVEPSASPVAFAADRARVVTPTGGGAFLAFELTRDRDAVTRAFVLGPSGATADIQLGDYQRPTVAYADAKRAWIVGHRGERDVDILQVDLEGARVVTRTPMPLCDRDAMRKKDRCRP